MISEETLDGSVLRWSDDALEMRIDLACGRRSALSSFSAQAPVAGQTTIPASPASRSGRCRSGCRSSTSFRPARAGSGSASVTAESVLGSRMRYVSHEQRSDGQWSTSRVAAPRPALRPAAGVNYSFLTGLGAPALLGPLTQRGRRSR